MKGSSVHSALALAGLLTLVTPAVSQPPDADLSIDATVRNGTVDVVWTATPHNADPALPSKLWVSVDKSEEECPASAQEWGDGFQGWWLTGASADGSALSWQDAYDEVLGPQGGASSFRPARTEANAGSWRVCLWLEVTGRRPTDASGAPVAGAPAPVIIGTAQATYELVAAPKRRRVSAVVGMERGVKHFMRTGPWKVVRVLRDGMPGGIVRTYATVSRTNPSRGIICFRGRRKVHYADGGYTYWGAGFRMRRAGGRWVVDSINGGNFTWRFERGAPEDAAWCA